MGKDPICGMAGHIRKHGHDFCSEHCAGVYEKGMAWYRERFWQALIAVIIVLVLAWFVPFLQPILPAFWEYFQIVWWAVLLGLLIGGIIEQFVPQEYVGHYLSKKSSKTIFGAAFLGFLLSACSHGILALAIQLYKKGASVPAVITFLLASPWANLPVTIMLFGFFGIKALYLVAGAIVIAITTGLVFQLLDKKGLIEQGKKVKEIKDVKSDLKKRWQSYKFDFTRDAKGVLGGTWSLNKMVTWWILLGILLASIAGAFVPEHIFHNYMGPTVIGLLITLIVATIIEVCSEGSSPIAFELYRQTGAFGNAFTFLMAGVVTDYTEIGLIWNNIGKRAALWLPAIAVPQVIALAWLFNTFLS